MRARLYQAAYARLLRPLLFRSFGGDPERIHEAMLLWLSAVAKSPLAGIVRLAMAAPSRPVTIAGVHFPRPVGVAAGLDKDGVAAACWALLGFGFAELGTVTAQAQPGNPSPRLFRLKASHGLINRMGFNNHGAQALADRLAALGVARGNGALGMPIGVSIGKTKVVPLDGAIEDYIQSLRSVIAVADYLAVNLSSPNTPGLRQLQAGQEMAALITALVSEAQRLDPNPPPIFVKLSPDMDRAGLDQALAAAVDSGAAGLIVSNTTLGRSGIAAADLALARQAGGLSGAPLTKLARQTLATAVSSGLPVMATGGMMTADDAQAAFDLGAAAVQLYSGFIYAGPGLTLAINQLGR
ncbi:MAG: quinone-dependent dihydroorotate dehydrogenase [Propionibacteriaceae bacterium]|jgi:dihydroorotate dehydrogenase|nr:quinone-dependent dihydroorotate dehydrogenase [Propionibacteriaceae bacterium]